MAPEREQNAVWSLQQITEHQRTLDWLITNKAGWLDTPFGSQLIYGTVRHYYSLETIIEQLLKKPLKSKDPRLVPLVVSWHVPAFTYEAAGLRIINDTVSACAFLGKNWAKGFINAVLRKVNLQKKKWAT